MIKILKGSGEGQRRADLAQREESDGRSSEEGEHQPGMDVLAENLAASHTLGEQYVPTRPRFASVPSVDPLALGFPS